MKQKSTPMGLLIKLVKDAYNQAEVAEGLGITPQYLSDILKGRRDISERVANALGFVKVVTFKEKPHANPPDTPRKSA